MILFSEDIYMFQHRLNESAISYIKHMDPDLLLSTSDEDIVKQCLTESVPQFPILDVGNTRVDTSETKVVVYDHIWGNGAQDVDGSQIEVVIPFSGDAQIFHIRPNSYSISDSYENIIVQNNKLHIFVAGARLDADNVREQIDNTIRKITKNLEVLKGNYDNIICNIENNITRESSERKKRLLNDRNIASSLGFTLKERAVSAHPSPIKRKASPISLPRQASFRPEPVLEKEHFEHILSVISNMSTVMEHSPNAFKTMGEEHLRFHFLVQLNGHYEGDASGETFNFNGKTDILIKVNGKNIFIAECKFWSGEKGFIETIDQILSYSSWRDSKAAIIIFNKNKNFTAVLDKIIPTAKSHPNFKRLGSCNNTEFRFVFSNKDDALKEITLAVLAFNI